MEYARSGATPKYFVLRRDTSCHFARNVDRARPSPEWRGRRRAYVTRHQLHDVLVDLWDETRQQEGRRTVLFVTHDVDEALTLADRILVFREGRQVDDFAVTAPRPRVTESLLRADMVAHKQALLHHLGLERSRAKAANVQASQ